MRMNGLGLAVGCVVVVSACVVRAEGPQAIKDNEELVRIFEADQKDRDTPTGIPADWENVNKRDAARRARVRQLIDANLLKTGMDYERAAFVFQHGDSADDILMAHILAVTAIGKGAPSARWLAAASLDRYLQRTGQPQVFGTQFLSKEGRQKWTMEPYNRTLVPPALRDANCVPGKEDQADTLKRLAAGKSPQPPKKRPCAEGTDSY